MQKPTHIKRHVLNRIQQERLTPTPRWRYTLYASGMALLWLITVLIGAIAVAVTLLAVWYQRLALFEASHDSWIALLIERLPVLWLLVLSISCMMAVYYLRHIRCGYRYPLWQLMASSMVVSLLVGFFMYAAGVAYAIDTSMGERMPMYASLVKQERALWQQPNEGRLLGRQVFTTLATSSTIILEDVAGKRWQVNVSELSPEGVALLASAPQVRLLGFMNNDIVHSFHACGAFRWMMDSNPNTSMLVDERDEFIKRIYRHETDPEEREIVLETVVSAQTVANSTGRCRNLPALKRMHSQRR